MSNNANLTSPRFRQSAEDATAAIARPSAYTLTYATADLTLANPTAVAVTDGDIDGTANGALEAVGATNSGDVSGAIENNFVELQAVTTALIADNLDLRQTVAALVADLQSVGLVQ